MSPYLPITPKEIGEHAIGAAQAGAAIPHLHARRAPDGRPAAEPEVFREFLPAVADATDAIINISTGGSTQMTIEQRLAAASSFSPELASLNMGTMNFVSAPIADRITEWRFDWEEQYVRNTYMHPFHNTFGMIERTLRDLG